MKKVSIGVFAFLICAFAYATVVVPTEKVPANANNTMVKIGNEGLAISVMDFANLSPREYMALSGKKLNLLDRIAFKKATKQLRSSFDENGTFKNGKLADKLSGGDVDGFLSDFHIGGFALGVFLGPIGVIIAYLLKEGPVKERRKWAWVGLILFILLGGFILF